MTYIPATIKRRRVKASTTLTPGLILALCGKGNPVWAVSVEGSPLYWVPNRSVEENGWCTDELDDLFEVVDYDLVAKTVEMLRRLKLVKLVEYKKLIDVVTTDAGEELIRRTGQDVEFALICGE